MDHPRWSTPTQSTRYQPDTSSRSSARMTLSWCADGGPDRLCRFRNSTHILALSVLFADGVLRAFGYPLPYQTLRDKASCGVLAIDGGDRCLDTYTTDRNVKCFRVLDDR
eukprot:340652-Pyramimonas_sp.AAC.1